MKQYKNSIALVVCYMGEKFPDYFDYFLKTVSWNPSVDVFVFSNIKNTEDLPKNIFIIDLDLIRFNEMASNKLGIKTNIDTPYKLCDFKIAYGKIFEDYLKKYTFWGPVDIDCLLGNIRDFFHEEFLDSYDFISTRREFPSGFLSLYRNNAVMSNLFMESRDWAKIYKSNLYYAFDECNFSFNEIVNNKKSILDINTNIETFAAVLEKKKNNLRIYMESIAHELQFRDLLEVSQCGAKQVGLNKPYIIIHFISLNRHLFKSFKKILLNDNKFYIDIFGLISCDEGKILDVETRNLEILKKNISINYKEVTIANDGKIILKFSAKEDAKFSQNIAKNVEISNLTLFKTQVLLFIHHNSGATSNDLVTFFNDSNVFSIQRESTPSLKEIELLILNTISNLIEHNHIYIYNR